VDPNAYGLCDWQVLGKGSFGKVMLVRYRGDQQLYAMKTLRKAALFKRNQVSTLVAKDLRLGACIALVSLRKWTHAGSCS
jgi:hypothetical protein